MNNYEFENDYQSLFKGYNQAVRPLKMVFLNDIQKKNVMIYEEKEKEKSISSDFYYIINNSSIFEPILDSETQKNLAPVNAENLDIHTSTLLDMFKDEDIDLGYKLEAEKFVIGFYNRMPIDTLLWLARIFQEYYKDEYVIPKLLYIVSHITSGINNNDAKLVGHLMIGTALGHKSPLVREYALRVVEKWRNETALVLIENTRHHEEKWLQTYMEKIKENLIRKFR